MAIRSLIADDKTAAGVGTDRVPTSAARILRYQLNVVASTTEEVVRSAGGWLCDRAMAGWDVNVLVAEGGDVRPLTILGATALDLDTGFVPMVRTASRIGALAVSADVLAADPHVRDEVLRVLKQELTEITVWGRQWPPGLGRQAESVQHRVSSAARAFKAHALAAAVGSADAVTATESLFQIGTGSFRPLYCL
jgi:hypothetical protein